MLLNKELHDLYSSPSVVRVMKCRKVRWVGHVGRMGEMECIQNLDKDTSMKISAWKTEKKMVGLDKHGS
jgi:hypothetical protein